MAPSYKFLARPSDSQGQSRRLSTLASGPRIQSSGAIWNPTHLDRIWQNGLYVSEHATTVQTCLYMYIQVHEFINVYVHVMYMYMM
jgi:hypothetical protein